MTRFTNLRWQYLDGSREITVGFNASAEYAMMVSIFDGNIKEIPWKIQIMKQLPPLSLAHQKSVVSTPFSKTMIYHRI